MSDPKRLTDSGGLGADLLRSARGDRPAAKARARTAGALGLAAGAFTASGITMWRAVAIGLVALGVRAGGVSMMSSPLDSAPLAPGRSPDEIPPSADRASSAIEGFLFEQSSS